MSKKVKQTEIEAKTEAMMFGVDDAVDVLMAKWWAKRQIILDSEREKIETVRSEHASTIEQVKAAVDTSKYNHTSEVLGISSRVRDVELRIGKTIEDSSIRVVLMLTDTDITGDNYRPEFGKYRVLPVSAADFAAITASNKMVAEAEEAYNKALDKLPSKVAIRSQLHAKVMEIKLVEAGLGNIFNNEEIQEIIAI